MDKVLVQLVLQQGEDRLSQPFMQVNCEAGHLTGLLTALADLGRYIPIRALIGNQIVTGVEIKEDRVSIKGQPINWVAGY